MFRSSSTIFCVYVLNGDTIECDKPKINCKKLKISQMSIMMEVSLLINKPKPAKDDNMFKM